MIDLTPKNRSKESLESHLRIYERKQKELSKYLNSSQIRGIAKHLGIKREQAIDAILTSLVYLGWRYEELKEHHTFWLSLVKTCIEIQDPSARWEKTKSLICEFIMKWYNNDLVYGAYEIIRASRIPPDVFLKKKSVTYERYPSFVDYCLQTVILFNTRNFNIPAEVFIDRWRSLQPNFCHWEFNLDGALYEFRFKDGEVKEKFVHQLGTSNDVWEFEDSHKPSSFIFETNKGKFKEEDIKEYLGKLPIPKKALSMDYNEMIALLFQHVELEVIAKHLQTITQRDFKSREDIEQELKSAYHRAFLRNMARALLPEYKGDCIGFSVFTHYPIWKPGNKLLDLQKLKIELGELYLSQLSKRDKIKAFTELVSFLEIDLLNYEQFRSLLKEWRDNGEYKEIESIFGSLKKLYSPAKHKKIETHRYYALLCLKAIKVALETKCNFEDACKAASERLKKEKIKIPLDAKLTPDYIRRRSYEIGMWNGRNSFDSEHDLQYLYYVLPRRYNWKESDI